MGPGDFFGERALLSEDLRAASCRAKGPAVVLSLDREHFEMMVGSLDDYDAKASETRAAAAAGGGAGAGAGGGGGGSSNDSGLTLNDIHYLGVLGEGAFGRVSLVLNKKDKGTKNPKTYALKAMKKSLIVDNNLEEHTINEKKVMEALNSPLLLQMYATFQDNCRLYLLLELCQGVLFF